MRDGDHDHVPMPARSRRPSRSPASSSRSSASPRRSPRRASFGPDDVFASPVEWSKHPSFARDADAVARILARGDLMCREEITPRYIAAALRDPDVAVWLVRDARARIFGFALTQQHPAFLELKLICTHRRKGEGAKLFRDILAYAREAKQELRLEAVHAKVALLYAREAHASGHAVFLSDSPQALPAARLEDAVRALGRPIAMRFAPPGHVVPAHDAGARHAPDVRSFKAAMRRLHRQDSDDDDD